MVITDEQDVLALETGEVLQKEDPDGPPPYSPRKPDPPEISPNTLRSVPTLPAIPSDLVPSNFLSVRRRGDIIKSRYLIDLGLPASHSEDRSEKTKERYRRKRQGGHFASASDDRDGSGRCLVTPNLKIRNTKGAVDASVWLVNNGPASGGKNGQKRRAILDVKNTGKPIKLELNADPTQTLFSLRLRSTHGSISLYIPRFFVGPLSISSRSINLSPSLELLLRIQENVEGRKTGFIGSTETSAQGSSSNDIEQSKNDEWKWSSIEVESVNGPVRICYVDDEEKVDTQANNTALSDSRPGPRFWSRLLGGGK